MELVVYFKDMWELALQGQTQGIFFWAALYAFVLCAYSLIFQIRTRYWPSTRGELAEMEIEKFGAADRVKSDQSYMSRALYKYKVSGVTYDGTRISPWIIVVSHNARFILEKKMSCIQRFPDKRVKVFYNPNNPRKSYLIVAGKVGICLTLFLCVLPVIAYYAKYHA